MYHKIHIINLDHYVNVPHVWSYEYWKTLTLGFYVYVINFKICAQDAQINIID